VMDRAGAGRRQSPPAIVWFLVGIVAAVTAACVVMAVVAWDEAQQIEGLQAEMESLRSERRSTEARVAALQGTATAVESRLTTLEANDPAQQLAALQAAVESASDSDELDALQVSFEQIQEEIDSFQTSLDDLAGRIRALEPATTFDQQSLPAEARITVARQRQSHSLSCESSAAAMVAQFPGLNISEADVLAALPLNDNPHLGFRGNIDGPTGDTQDYGVYAEPILAYLNSHGLKAWSVAGGLEGIKAAIARGNPVIAWMTYNCMVSTPIEVNVEGQAVTLVPYQHVVVVTGYNAGGVWANDPWDGQEDFYSFDDFERATGYLGDMAIEVAAP